MINKGTTLALKTLKLTKVYGEGPTAVHALKGISIDFPSGEFTAIMGASGSGKSTLLHILGGLDRPSSGDVTVGDTSLVGLNDRKLTLMRRERMGFIFQFFNLIPTLSAEENILLPALISGEDPRQYNGRLEELLDLVGLLKRKYHRPDELSGGEQQRVAIARALIKNPDIILADEPTGNLDSRTGSGILQLLRESVDRMGQTILMVTHDPRAAAVADRIVFLRDGKVVDETRSSTPEEILERITALETAE